MGTVYSAIKIAGPAKFKVGDSVRVSKYKTIFEKGWFKLEEYEYEIIHKPGKVNANADTLSRYVSTINCEEDKKKEDTLVREYSEDMKQQIIQISRCIYRRASRNRANTKPYSNKSHVAWNY